jgi:hypothetical protein
LFGNNRISRSQQDRFNPRRIMLMAELTAVADVCSALSSDRTYRAALPPAEIVRIMREMSGDHLNSQAVEAFVGMVELFPAGLGVRIAGGKYNRCIGVVVAQSPKQRDRPVVRLLFDRAAKPLGEGMEIRMHEQPDYVELHSIPETGASLVEQAFRLAQPNAA